MKILSSTFTLPLLAMAVATAALTPARTYAGSVKPEGCIIATDTRERFCLGLDAGTEVAIPDRMRGKTVDVHADNGVAVTLTVSNGMAASSPKRTTLVGTVTHGELMSMHANGEWMNFSKPLRMSVARSATKLGCIVTLDRQEKFCRPAGAFAAYALPSWIGGRDVSVQADPGIVVLLSNKANLGFGNIDMGAFTGSVDNAALKTKIVNGRLVDFSKPYWMSAESSFYGGRR